MCRYWWRDWWRFWRAHDALSQFFVWRLGSTKDHSRNTPSIWGVARQQSVCIATPLQTGSWSGEHCDVFVHSENSQRDFTVGVLKSFYRFVSGRFGCRRAFRCEAPEKFSWMLQNFPKFVENSRESFGILENQSEFERESLKIRESHLKFERIGILANLINRGNLMVSTKPEKMLFYVLLVFSLIAYVRNQSFYISPGKRR